MPAPRPGPALRCLFPSIADLLFVGLLLTRLQPTLFHDGDTGWHLWAGNAVLAHGPGAIPDALSFTRAGVPFENVEWLGEALMSLLYRHGGYLGIALLVSAVFAGTFSWVYRILLRESRDPVAALGVTVLAAQIALLQFLARPLVFSYPLFLGVVELARRAPSGRRAVIGIPLLTVLWANLHPSATLAPAIAAFFWLRRPRDRAAGLAMVLAVLALGATPWGYSWVRSMPAANRPYFALVEEWGSPRFGELRFLPLLLFLVLALAARRRGDPLPAWAAIWGGGWTVATLVSTRFGPYAALAWSPFLARDLARGDLIGAWRPLGRLWRGIRDALAPMEEALRPGVWPVLAGGAALVLAPALGPVFPRAAAGFPTDRFPARALAAADSLGVGPRVLCNYAWGGYVGWVSGGKYRTFIDGRAGFFGGDLLGDYLTLMALDPGWEDALRRADPDWMLLSPDLPLVSAAPLTGEWRVADRETNAAILVRSPRP